MTYSFVAIDFWCFSKMQISIFTSQKSSRILWEYWCRTLSKRGKSKNISKIHQIFWYLLLLVNWFPCPDGVHIVGRWCSTPCTEAKETLYSVPILWIMLNSTRYPCFIPGGFYFNTSCNIPDYPLPPPPPPPPYPLPLSDQWPPVTTTTNPPMPPDSSPLPHSGP